MTVASMCYHSGRRRRPSGRAALFGAGRNRKKIPYPHYALISPDVLPLSLLPPGKGAAMPIDRADLAAGAYIRETATRRPYEVTRYRPDRGMVDLEDPMSPLTSPRVADGRSIMLAPRTRSLGVCHVEASFELLHAAPTLGEMVHPGDVADMLEWGRAGGE